MDEMVERVAKAMCKDTGAKTYCSACHPDIGCTGYLFKDYARDIIAAMREPTDAMVFRGVNAAGALFEASPSEAMREGWRAMIDAVQDR